MEGLFEVLRSEGYQGSGMMDLAAATGLKKASLYHRFPGGKKQITEEVLNYVLDWSKTHIVAVLSNAQVEPEKRLVQALKNIKALYRQGSSICIFRTLATENGMDLFGDQLKAGIEMWIKAFESIGRDLGFRRREYRQMALDTVIKIQGSLVLAKTMQTNRPFQATLEQIRKSYLT